MDKLSKIATGTEELVRMLGAEGVPPQLILSTEVNMPARRRK
jgi:hypothetical protein